MVANTGRRMHRSTSFMGGWFLSGARGERRRPAWPGLGGRRRVGRGRLLDGDGDAVAELGQAGGRDQLVGGQSVDDLYQAATAAGAGVDLTLLGHAVTDDEELGNA